MATEELAGCTCTLPTDLRQSECDLHTSRDAPVYDNESFWYSAPIRENYIGLDRGTRTETASMSPLAEGLACSTARRRDEFSSRPRRARL